MYDIMAGRGSKSRPCRPHDHGHPGPGDDAAPRFMYIYYYNFNYLCFRFLHAALHMNFMQVPKGAIHNVRTYIYIYIY